MAVSEELAKNHYADLAERPFFPKLVEFICSSPVVAMCWEGLDVVAQGRSMIGATNPLKSLPGSIRGDYSIEMGKNVRATVPFDHLWTVHQLSYPIMRTAFFQCTNWFTLFHRCIGFHLDRSFTEVIALRAVPANWRCGSMSPSCALTRGMPMPGSMSNAQQTRHISPH